MWQVGQLSPRRVKQKEAMQTSLEVLKGLARLQLVWRGVYKAYTCRL